jgi:hypothetical protein
MVSTIAQADKNARNVTWSDALRRGLVSGTVAGIVSTISLAILGKAELGKPAAPVNGPSQWVWGKHAPHEDRFTLRYTILGHVVHHASSVFWAILYERLCQRLGKQQEAPAVAPALLTAAAAYTVDFHVVPPRLSPGFERRLSQRSILLVYGSFALGLAIVSLASRNRNRNR